jgi:Flp pilus assembly protein TadB
MSSIIQWITSVPPAAAAVAAAILATIGWLYTSRRNRRLSRKQHTFNSLLQSSFNEQFQSNRAIIRPYIVASKFPDDLMTGQHDDLRKALTSTLNFYEFISAGVRNGDISEALLRDSERSTIVRLFDVAQKYVSTVRDARNRRTYYEHLEWLYVRWHEGPPSVGQRVIEWAIQKPLYHDRHKWAAYSIAALLLFVLVVAYLHLPGELFNSQALLGTAASSH